MRLRPLRLELAPPQSRAREAARLLWDAVKPFRRRAALAVVLLVLAKLATVAVPLVLKGIIDALGRPEDLVAVPVLLLLGYAILRFAGTLFGELRDLVFSRVSLSTVAEFGARAFEHLLRLSPRFHVRRQTGRLTREVERGTAGIGFLLGMGLFTIVPTLVEIAAVLGILLSHYAATFSAIILVTFVFYTTFTVAFTQRREVHQRRVNDLDFTANSRLVDGLLNYETVKASATEALEGERFRSLMQQSISLGVQNQKALSTLHVGQSAIIALGVASVMLLAGAAVVRGDMSVGDLVLVNAYVIQICLPLNALGFVFRQASDALVDAERLLSLLRQKPEIREPPDTPALEEGPGEVRFEHVDFSYEPGRRILWDVDFRVPSGATVAVVGGSGSGKSTLARLLLRFYDVDGGAVRVDGQDIRNVTQASLRAAIGVVPQDTILFNNTIAYNIAYGRPGAGLAEVIEAAKAAQLHEFILSLPEGYETVVGERGLKLSGGEKQRIAIARVVLRNPRILVFDEATSALDARSERAIQAELERLSRQRTTLVIAHRLSTVVDADEILVLERGRIVERGTHQALLELRGLYAQMWSLQREEQELARRERRVAAQPVSLAGITASVIDALRPSIDERGLSLYTTLEAQPLRVTADARALQGIVWELCANAVEVTPEGGRIELEVLRADGYARLKVTDTGGLYRPGEPLRAGGRHVDDQSVDVEAMRAELEQYGGRLSVETLPGGAGTSYLLDLPLRAVAAGTDDGLRPPGVAANGDGRAPSLSDAYILVVDDEDEARELLAAVLAGQGASVRTKAGGEEAVRWFEERRIDEWPDLLICDIALPGRTDGYEVVRRVRAIEAGEHVPVTSRMPAIALTGLTGQAERTEALIAGFQLHLGKPVDPRELIAAAATLIDFERAHARARRNPEEAGVNR